MINFKNVNYTINNKKILNNISFTIKDNDIVLLSGPSGSGKTTILNLLVKNIKPTSGKIYVNNKDLETFTNIKLNKYRKEDIHIILQEDDLFEDLTVHDNLSLYYSEDDIINFLTKCNMLTYLNFKVKNLSGGQRQRIAIIKSAISSCKILLCDEITSALDDSTALKFIDLILELYKGKTIIFISHTPNLYINKVNKILHINKGSLYEEKIKDPDTYVNKNKKTNKNFVNLLLTFGLKKISLFHFIITIISFISILAYFNLDNIYNYIIDISNQNYIDNNVYEIKNNSTLQVNNIDIYYDFSNNFSKEKIYINSEEYTNVSFKGYFKENDSLFIINKAFLYTYMIESINYISIPKYHLESADIELIEDNNLFTTPCIYFNIYNTYKLNIKSDDLYYVSNHIDNSIFMENPLFESSDLNLPYLENNAYLEKLIYIKVFDSITMLIDYFSLIVLIYSLIVSCLIFISFIYKDLKHIAIFILQGISIFKIKACYLLPLLLYFLLTLIVLKYVSISSYIYSLIIVLFSNLLAITISFFIVKKKKLIDILKEDYIC